MKTLGIIGGLSWFSTTVYYRTINKLVNEKLGGTHSAKLLLYSIDFEEFEYFQKRNDWEGIGLLLSGIARNLEKAGADCIILASNTPHLVADKITESIGIPFIHIADETANEILLNSIRTVGLLGTKFTMENSFFKDRLKAKGIHTILPGEEDRNFIHASIFNELTKGIFNAVTKKRMIQIMDNLVDQGADGIIFGCTEISLLINPNEYSSKIFDTTFIHSKAAVDFATNGN